MSEEIENKNMDPSLLPTLIKAAPAGFWKTLYKDLGQSTVQVLGKTLSTAVEFCSIPVLCAGYLTDKVKLNFSHRLKEYSNKLEDVQEEKLCEVDPQIGAPILDHLQYTTNDEIADLFTTLLANASNLDTLDKAHPSFAHLISRLSVDEARIIKYLKDKEELQYCSFMADVKGEYDGGFITIIDHATLLPFETKLAFPDNIRAYLSNLVSLGILEDMDSMYRADDTIYDEICSKNNLDSLRKKYQEDGFKDVSVTKSFYEVTPFGRLFISACIKESQN